MRKTVALLLLLALAMPAFALPGFALEGTDAVYTGGTLAQLKEGAEGKLDLTHGSGLQFVSAGVTYEIPYERIESYEHSNEVAVHLGIVAHVVVSLVKKRWRNHFVRISFTDVANLHQVAVFEIPKSLPMVLMPALIARAPQAHCAPEWECKLPRPTSRPAQAEQKPLLTPAVNTTVAAVPITENK
jgi:hypothetical protein